MHGNGSTNKPDRQAGSVSIEADRNDDSAAKPVPRPRAGMKLQPEVEEKTDIVS